MRSTARPPRRPSLRSRRPARRLDHYFAVIVRIAQRAKRLAGRIVRGIAAPFRSRPKSRPWVTTVDVRHPRPLEGLRLYAILGTWCEADIVAATVKNALQQG